MPSVEVNLNVNADATGSISVFGQPKDIITNLVVASQTLAASDLYSAAASGAKALFRFKEPADRTLRSGEVVTGFNTDSTILSGHLNGILCAGIDNSLDASHASTAPFNHAKYDGATADKYRKYKSFGELVFAMYCHDLFGHVQATTAIDNDPTFIAGVNNNTTGSQLGFNLAAAIYSMTGTAATAVVNQVLGQDAGRAMDQDNSEISPETWQDLKWYADDIVYVSVTAKTPTITVSGATPSAQLGEPLASAVTERTYMVKITLA